MKKIVTLVLVWSLVTVAMLGFSDYRVLAASSVSFSFDEESRSVTVDVLLDADAVMTVTEGSYSEFMLMHYNMETSAWELDERKTLENTGSTSFHSLTEGVYVLFRNTAEDFISSVVDGSGIFFSVDSSGMRELNTDMLKPGSALAIGLMEVNAVFLYIAEVTPTPTPTPLPVSLLVEIEGKGTISPVGQSSYEKGDTAVFGEPVPAEGYRFSGFFGTNGNEISNKRLLMNENKYVIVRFIENTAAIAAATPTATVVPTTPKPDIIEDDTVATGNPSDGGTQDTDESANEKTIKPDDQIVVGSIVTIPDEPVPAALQTAEAYDSTQPPLLNSGNSPSKDEADDDQLLLEESVPQGVPMMPRTGGLPIGLVFSLGVLLVLDGIFLHRRMSADEDAT